MNEAGVWKYLRKGMKSAWIADRIENMTSAGVPDVTFAIKNRGGWMELKYIPMWPKRAATIVKLPLRPEQYAWFFNRQNYDTFIFAFVRIQNDFFLLDCDDVLKYYSCGATKAMWEADLLHWNRRIDFKELERTLRRLA